MASHKKFLGVYFVNKQWEVIPSKWATKIGNTNRSYWPTEGSIEVLARNNTTPRKNWTEWTIKDIVVSSGI